MVLSLSPTMVKLSVAAMFGGELVKRYGELVGAVSVIVFAPPAVMAALMSAIRDETVAAE